MEFQLNESGTVYYLINENGGPVPDKEEVLSGNSFQVFEPDTPYIQAIYGLSPETSYDIYIIARDNELVPNIQSGIIKLEATTGSVSSTDKYVVLNQLGFYPDQPKVAVVWNAIGDVFYLVNSEKTDTLYTGALSDAKNWEYSSQDVRQAIFSDFREVGTYYLLVPGIGYSQVFEISGTVYSALSRALVKMFYFQRASTALLPEYAGQWARASGHPDNKVEIHSSAATSMRPSGTIISCPKGWYDAGDYNKYIVSSGITMYTLMLAYEQFYEFTGDFDLNLPESNNDIPDILDEVLWNLRWMLSMQDPNDGGVYHKLTTTSFENVVMPVNATKTRYVIQKSTAATLDFAANMAQASRIFNRYPDELPGLADSCLFAAEYAWDWAIANPNMLYDQDAMNRKYSPSISTGQYKDSNLPDEFFWAASELFITTGRAKYLSKVDYTNQTFYAPYWPGVGTLALMSLNRYADYLPEDLNTREIKNKLLDVANTLKNYAETSAYGIPMGERSDNFKWGSNAVAGYQSMVLAQAYLLTGNADYMNAAYANFDYLLGRNPTHYSYVTGFGNNSPENPHHRPSEADNEVDPVPGMVVGGPHSGQQDGCTYESTLPALCYTDEFCSYATNEITIYWNAPMAYMGILFEANRVGKLSPPFSPRWKTNLSNYPGTIQNPIRIYPNPADEILNIEVKNAFNGSVQIYNCMGMLEIEKRLLPGESSGIAIDISRLPAGLYFIGFKGDNYQEVTKLIIY